MSPDCETLRRRAGIVRAIRAFFDARGFTEIETPVRIAAPAPEFCIDCPPVATGGYLRASPELQMKKLLAAGFDRIYQLGPCFRDGERGRRHQPEFTMLEWYRRGEDDDAVAADLAGLLGELGLDDPARFVSVQVRDLYRECAGWDPWAGWDADRFDYDMAAVIEPELRRRGGGIFLRGYPAAAAALARVDGDTARRWEFYWNGLELANCFTELCDGREQRARFEREREKRRLAHESDYPLDEEFLAAVDRIGSAAGIALGVDRLVMALLGAGDIAAVRLTDG